MKIIHKISQIREITKNLNVSVGLVPTMGALHSGHASLIEKSVKDNGFTIVSVFVNPVQFGINEDFDKYPRTLENDAQLCEKLGADVVFAPSVDEMYQDTRELTLVCPPYSAINKLCGKSRPGHFDGVATVVSKLFNITKCTRAYFGQKDAQQLFIIKKMVKDLNFDIEIVPCPIIRESDGLALSSRNSYLDENARKEALKLSRALNYSKELWQKGIRDKDILRDSALKILEGLDVDYVEIVDPETFEDWQETGKKALMLIAAKIPPTNTRLIDNMEL
ncbi:TPA: pantoate--beta-alanine ligase [Candidatus Galligastranaerophilus intestinavium]|uniref:Pantothenate synthetase n=1 Tax=Candidatus Galligastranaerophilus intestinavium TaxID=2840836 RepID=A0A9D1JXM5_9BACT|nr:pantoate--beta-alanine ligase [Candidatus Galligastranaerophilus intestinavium]